MDGRTDERKKEWRAMKERKKESVVLLSWLDIFHSVLIKVLHEAHLGLKLIFSGILTVSALVSQIRHFLACELLDRSAHCMQNPVHFKSRCNSDHRALDSQSTCAP